jgi:hypothetical protein
VCGCGVVGGEGDWVAWVGVFWGTRDFGTERGFGFTLDIFNFGIWNGRSREGIFCSYGTVNYGVC